MSRRLTRPSLLPATLLLAALAACAGDPPTAPRHPDLRRALSDSVPQNLRPPSDSSASTQGNYENPKI